MIAFDLLVEQTIRFDWMHNYTFHYSWISAIVSRVFSMIESANNNPLQTNYSQAAHMHTSSNTNDRSVQMGEWAYFNKYFDKWCVLTSLMTVKIEFRLLTWNWLAPSQNVYIAFRTIYVYVHVKWVLPKDVFWRRSRYEFNHVNDFDSHDIGRSPIYLI